jgi:alcohol dehydrogenase class IV
MFDQARALIQRFKGDSYVHGLGVLPRAGALAAHLGRRAVLVRDTFPGFDSAVDTLLQALRSAGVEIAGVVPGAAPNAPLEDLHRVTGELQRLQPDLLISFGGGSTIDCVKAAEVLRTLGGGIESYFGTGLVTARLKESGRSLAPHLAIQTAASSAAHLTKYSNITDAATAQKKLIVDDAVVPARALFDYETTLTAPASLTADGALDGLSHSLEVYYGATGKPDFPQVEAVALTGIALVARWLPIAIERPHDREAREGLGLATDLGGYAIMLGGTNGAHLTSFSLVDVLSHGRACALLNPYYTVFFAPAIQPQLRKLAEILCPESVSCTGRALGIAVASAIIALERRVGNPTTLNEVPGFNPGHVTRALAAAKNPQLRMKLENMPVPLTPDLIDGYMGPVLEAARTGDLSLIREMHPVREMN